MKYKVDKKTLVITDPCYIKHCNHPYLKENTIYGDWSCMCYKCNKDEAKEKVKEWDDFYLDFFHKYNFNGLNKEEKQKLYEEYKQRKDSFLKENCYGEFSADSGRVAVYDYDEMSKEDQEWIKEHPWCACIIPEYSGSFEYVVEEDGSAHIDGEGFYTTQSGF